MQDYTRFFVYFLIGAEYKAHENRAQNKARYVPAERCGERIAGLFYACRGEIDRNCVKRGFAAAKNDRGDFSREAVRAVFA